jgi:arginine repressor
MERKPLPKDLREMLGRHKIQTQKELRETLKHLTPEQLKHVRSLVSDRFAKGKRSRFKIITGGRATI